jgi:hypothetical protein
LTASNDSETPSGLNDRVVTDVLRLAPIRPRPAASTFKDPSDTRPDAGPGALVQHRQEAGERLRVVPLDAPGDNLAPATFIAAMIETVPWRLHSNSRRASRPGRAVISGRVRVFAWMPVFSSMLTRTVPVFSSMLTRTVPGGGSRHRRQTGERSDQPARLVEGQRVLGWREPLGELDIASSGRLR